MHTCLLLCTPPPAAGRRGTTGAPPAGPPQLLPLRKQGASQPPHASAGVAIAGGGHGCGAPWCHAGPSGLARLPGRRAWCSSGSAALMERGCRLPQVMAAGAWPAQHLLLGRPASPLGLVHRYQPAVHRCLGPWGLPERDRSHPPLRINRAVLCCHVGLQRTGRLALANLCRPPNTLHETNLAVIRPSLGSQADSSKTRAVPLGCRARPFTRMSRWDGNLAPEA